MSDTTAGSGRRRRAWPLTARSVGAIIAMAILAIPAAAFGGSRSSTVALGTSTPRPSALSQSTGTQKALAYSRCMRSHGVSNFPDPSSSGVIPKVSLAELGVSSSQFEAAEKACQALLPPGTDDQFPPGEVQQLLIGMLRFSRCMRTHGVPNWPDPTTDSEGRPVFPLPEAGISHQQARSSQVTRAAQGCQHLLPAALAGIPIG